MDKITHQVRLDQWTNIINECLASGMKKTAWCKANGISPKTFFYWQRKLREEAFQKSQTPAVIAEDSPAASLPSTFVELPQLTDDLNDSAGFRPDIIIRSGKTVIEISNSASREILSVLGGILHAE